MKERERLPPKMRKKEYVKDSALPTDPPSKTHHYSYSPKSKYLYPPQFPFRRSRPMIPPAFERLCRASKK